MMEVLTPLPICSPSGLVIQALGQSSAEDKLSSHRRRETGLDGEPLESPCSQPKHRQILVEPVEVGLS